MDWAEACVLVDAARNIPRAPPRCTLASATMREDYLLAPNARLAFHTCACRRGRARPAVVCWCVCASLHPMASRLRRPRSSARAGAQRRLASLWLAQPFRALARGRARASTTHDCGPHRCTQLLRHAVLYCRIATCGLAPAAAPEQLRAPVSDRVLHVDCARHLAQPALAHGLPHVVRRIGFEALAQAWPRRSPEQALRPLLAAHAHRHAVLRVWPCTRRLPHCVVRADAATGLPLPVVPALTMLLPAAVRRSHGFGPFHHPHTVDPLHPRLLLLARP